MAGVAAILIAYVIGSIPFGFLLVKFSTGRDVRAAGSGNIGATNVLRTSGRTAGVVTLVLDIAKGFLAVWLAAGSILAAGMFPLGVWIILHPPRRSIAGIADRRRVHRLSPYV